MAKDRLVDLHCHMLPGIDDGSPSLEKSIELANAAVVDGIGYILATPHHLNRHFINHASEVKRATENFQAELDRRKIDLKVFASQEVHLNGELMANLTDLLGIDEARHYLLLELPHETVPRYLTEIIFQLSCEGITPVIAHPERNAAIMEKPSILYDLTKQGALAQVTASSLVGVFGKHVQKTAKELVRCGLVQVVASDAHALSNRQFVLTESYQLLGTMDSKYPEWFSNNAKMLLNGIAINLEAITVPHKGRKFIF